MKVKYFMEPISLIMVLPIFAINTEEKFLVFCWLSFGIEIDWSKK